MIYEFANGRQYLFFAVVFPASANRAKTLIYRYLVGENPLHRLTVAALWEPFRFMRPARPDEVGFWVADHQLRYPTEGKFQLVGRNPI